jgi:hypothetical protein
MRKPTHNRWQTLQTQLSKAGAPGCAWARRCAPNCRWRAIPAGVLAMSRGAATVRMA